MKYTFLKTLALIFSAFAFLVLTGCGSSGTPHDTQLVGGDMMENKVPVAVAGLDQTVNKGAVVTLDAGASYDEDGDIVLYQWKLLDGTVLSEEVIFEYDTSLTEVGVYDVILLVKDDQGATGVDTASITITISDDGVEPTCLETAGYGTVAVGNSQIWLDRNLGASRVASATDDTAAYGNLYQWGRGADGHESRTSSIINEDGYTYATVITPNAGNAWDGKFIDDDADWGDWVDDYSDEKEESLRIKLWSTASDVESNKNQVCPCGFVVPSEADYAALTASDIASLKFTYGGYRDGYDDDGEIGNFDRGYYWTTESRGEAIFNNNTFTDSSTSMADGLSVRCIDPSTSIPDES